MDKGCVPKWMWAVLLLLHATSFAWALHSGHWRFQDSGRYRQTAVNLVTKGQLYAQPWPAIAPRGQAVEEFTIRPVGYPFVLAVLGGSQGFPWLVLLLQNCLSFSVLGWMLNWWARIGRPQPGHWLGAVGLIIGFPAQVIYANAVMSELPLQICLMAGIGSIALLRKTGDARYGWAAAAAVTAALLLKPVCYPLAGVWLVGAGCFGWQQRRNTLMVAAMLPLVVVAGYMRWNEQRTGYFHFSSIAEINLLHYNAAGVVREVAGPVAEGAWVASVVRAANGQPNFATRQHFIRQQADSVLLTHAVVYARQHALGMVALLLDPGRFDISEFLGLRPPAGGGLLGQVRAVGWVAAMRKLPLGLLGLLTFLTLGNFVRLALAIRGFYRLRQGPVEWQVGRWLAVGLLTYIALLTGPLGAARFLVPVWPLLFMLALVGIKGPVSGPIKPMPRGCEA